MRAQTSKGLMKRSGLDHSFVSERCSRGCMDGQSRRGAAFASTRRTGVYTILACTINDSIL